MFPANALAAGRACVGRQTKDICALREGPQTRVSHDFSERKTRRGGRLGGRREGGRNRRRQGLWEKLRREVISGGGGGERRCEEEQMSG